MPTPFIENLHLIRDQVTQKTFVCTANALSVPLEFRTAIIPVPNADGGVDAHAGNRDYLAPRTITANLIHVYAAGESFKTVMNALELVIGQGHPLELTMQEEDATLWLWQNVRLQKFDKKMALDWASHVEIPLVFIAPDPHQRAVYRSDLYYLDNGLYLDNGFYLDDDPDNFPLTGTTTTHTINNSVGGLPAGADNAPIVSLQGATGGPITLTYTDDAGVGITWTYFGNIQAGETVTVDAEQLEVTSTNGATYAYGNFALGKNQEFWGRIAPGVTTVTVVVGSVSGSSSCRVVWANRK